MNNLPRPIIIVQGGQWGSEAKGTIAAHLALHREVNYAVRTGAVNAGHTVYYRDEVECKMQQLPTAWVNPKTQLILGAGSMINPSILATEIRDIFNLTGEDVRNRLIIDRRAGLHLHLHQDFATAAGRHHKMGATGKGCSEAITAKISQRGNPHPLLFDQWLHDWGVVEDEVGTDLASWLTNLTFGDTEHILNEAYDCYLQILIEATQGTLLDLHLGPYPYTTHKQTIASQWITECGLSPNLEYEIVLVCRTYPIRVAGNSGPMPREIMWDDLADCINRKLASRGLPPLIHTSALDEFHTACKDIATHKYLPLSLCPVDITGTVDINFARWPQSSREQYRVILSELHKDALAAIGPTSLNALRRLFEMTTVTRKLRRVADWDLDTMRASIRQNRPDHVILTFLNYEFPEYWGCADAKLVMGDRRVHNYLRDIEDSWGCTVSAVTTGPLSKHVLRTNALSL